MKEQDMLLDRTAQRPPHHLLQQTRPGLPEVFPVQHQTLACSSQQKQLDLAADSPAKFKALQAEVESRKPRSCLLEACLSDTAAYTSAAEAMPEMTAHVVRGA